MTLNRTLRPGERESRLHRRVIFFERLCKAAEFGDAQLFNLLEPGIKAFPLPLSQHGRKFLDEFIGLSDLLICFAELGEILLLPFQALLFFKRDPMSHL